MVVRNHEQSSNHDKNDNSNLLLVSTCVMTCDRIDQTIESIESLLKITESRPPSVAVELVVLMNGTSEYLFDRFMELTEQVRNDFYRSIVLRSEVNKGVSGGRNELFRAASGEILFFMDDDALLMTDPEEFWSAVLAEYNGKVGILAFRSVSVDGTDRMKEIPTKEPDLKTRVASFVGVGHVIFRKAIDCSRLYPDNLFYGMEEFYLSCRIINNGFEIQYNPNLVVCHRKSDLTRLESSEYYIHLASNKVYVSLLCFGLLRRMSFFFLWSIWLMKKTRFSIRVYFGFLTRLRTLARSSESRDLKLNVKSSFWRYLKSVNKFYWK